MDNEGMQSKIHDLEARIAFQDETIDALNERVSEQDKLLSTLELHVHHLASKLKEIRTESGVGVDGADASHEVPPHY